MYGIAARQFNLEAHYPFRMFFKNTSVDVTDIRGFMALLWSILFFLPDVVIDGFAAKYLSSVQV